MSSMVLRLPTLTELTGAEEPMCESEPPTSLITIPINERSYSY